MSPEGGNKYKNSLFIFRRDLRLNDNTALLEACRTSGRVIPAFFLDGRLLDPSGNKYRPNLLQFMFESLEDLDRELKSKGSRLYIFYGKDIFSALEKLLGQINIDAVFVNEDYTPFSINRDREFDHICRRCNTAFHSRFDLLLSSPGEVLNSDNEPYRVYSWFFKTAKALRVRKPETNNFTNYYQDNINSAEKSGILKDFLTEHNPMVAQRGGRKNALRRLYNLSVFTDYNEKRNFPAEEGTTKLSAHLKFGTVSPREVYREIKNSLDGNNRLINELYWRDFFAHISYFYPHIFTGAFNRKYEDIYWENDKYKFRKWCDGNTGFPIVDAGMRQLNQTGWMHNRVRMIVASFLTKDLHIDWRWGERYFASKLVDYDPCSNNGGWQWAASTGADAQPYFRIFNPWLQQKRYDPDASYIKKYLPELGSLVPEDIHDPYGEKRYTSTVYPKPIVDHAVESGRAKDYYKTA